MVWNIHVRTGLMGSLSVKQKERLLAHLQKNVDGLTYNIEQAIAKFASQEGIDVKVGTWAFGGRD